MANFPLTAMRAVTGLNVLVMSGFSLAALGSAQPSLAFALYAAARTIPLALFVLWAIYRQNASALLILGGLAGVIQILDAGVGVVQQDMGKTVGPIMIAVLQFAALFYLRKSVNAPRP
jgi:hypothetical protein